MRAIVRAARNGRAGGTGSTFGMPETLTISSADGQTLNDDLPLCVDLDGTLVKSDTLVDAVLLLLRQQPRSPLHWLSWLQWPQKLGGDRAGFKREITDRAIVEVEHLPYNQPLLAYLREERERGRKIYLATAADQAFADLVAAHVGLFDGVLASNGKINLAGENKLRAFAEQFPAGFSLHRQRAARPCLCCSASHQPMVANPHRALRKALQPATARCCTANSAIRSRLQKCC